MMNSKYRASLLIEPRSGWGSFYCKMIKSDAEKLGLTLLKNTTIPKIFFAALSKQKHDKTNSHGLYISVSVINELNLCTIPHFEKLHSDEHTITLIVCETFLRHYSLSETDVLYIQKAECLSLKSVIYAAKTQAAYDWTRTDGWSDKLITSTAIQPVLCRHGDILLADPKVFPGVDPSLLLDLVALDCNPVLQGLLTVKTSVTILRVPWEAPPPATESSQQSVHSILNLMTYTSRLLLPASSSGTVASSSILNNAIMRVVNKKFPVCILAKPLQGTNRLDIHDTVFLNQQVLTAHKLKDGSWARVRLSQKRLDRESWSSDPLDVGGTSSSPGSSRRVPQRQMSIPPPAAEEDSWREKLVQLFALPQPLPGGDNAARITPLLWFNLNGHPSPLEQPGRLLLLQELGVEPPPFAQEVYVSLVQTSNYKVSLNCDHLLRQYFSHTRCLQKGDILALPTRGHAEAYNHNWKNCLVWPVVYFQVSLVDGPGTSHHRVDSSHTKLYQSGACQNYLPVTMEVYGSPWQPLHPLWHSHCPPGMEPHVHKLGQLISPFLQDKEFRGQVSSCILLSGPAGSGKALLVRAVSRCLNIQIFAVESQELVGESPGATEARFKNIATRALTYAPCILLLKDVSAVGKEKEALGEDPRIVSSFCEMLSSMGSSQGAWPVVTVATSRKPLSVDMESIFLHRLSLEPPSREQRAAMLQALLSPLQTSREISWPFLAQRTTGLVLGDLSLLTSLACQEAFLRVKAFLGEEGLSRAEVESAVALAGVPLIQADLVKALEQMNRAQAQAIGAPEIPEVRWEDVGGLKLAKEELLDTVQLPLLYPHLLQAGLRRSGVLLHGPPGTGKTLLAKAVATECSLSFLSVKGPELINAYVGQSEENIRQVFERARSAAPCIIFFDELDSLGPNRGRSGDSAGVMDRVVSQLLAELDGLHKSQQVFVIGATNRIDLLDPALLRPGRFDRLVKVGLAQDPSGRLEILGALTRNFLLSEDVDLVALEAMCPAQMSGADFYGLCADANMTALERCIHLIEAGEADESGVVPEVTLADFRRSLRGSREGERGMLPKGSAGETISGLATPGTS